jgi:hypothetical protein
MLPTLAPKWGGGSLIIQELVLDLASKSFQILLLNFPQVTFAIDARNRVIQLRSAQLILIQLLTPIKEKESRKIISGKEIWA